MDWKKLSDQAKKIVDQRGGTESVKEDAEELAEIAGREATWSEKLKAAAQAIREPGRSGGAPPTGEQPAPGGDATPASGEPGQPAQTDSARRAVGHRSGAVERRQIQSPRRSGRPILGAAQRPREQSAARRRGIAAPPGR